MMLVDTSAWIEFFRKQGDSKVKHAVARQLQRDEAAFTCPIRFELLSGAKPNEETDVTQALALSRHVLFEPGDWLEAADLERELRRVGVTIPRNDLFVATVAIRTGFRVLCRDQHFDRMHKVFGPRLKVDQV
jgi:predicted nucleic acid-binding protein